MGNIVTIGNGKILVTKFLLGEFGGDFVRSGGKAVGVGGFDVDLLKLVGASKLTQRFGTHNEGIVKINTVEIDGLVDLVEDADDHEFFTHDGDGFANGTIHGIKEGERKSVA